MIGLLICLLFVAAGGYLYTTMTTPEQAGVREVGRAMLWAGVVGCLYLLAFTPLIRATMR